jgi:hypothetical protein
MVEGLFQGSLFFVSGLVVIIAVVGIVYAISWFFDRVSGSADSLLTPEELEQRRLATGLVRHAGLAGMLPAEQNRVMRHFFEKSSYPYVKDPVDDDDIEAHKNRKEDEPPKEKESNRIEDIATTAEVNSDDGTASTDEKGHVPEKVDEKDLEADLENQTDETIEEGEATDMEADAKKEAECIKNRGIAHTEEAANNDETVQDEDMNAHLEADTVEGNSVCVSLSDLPSSHSISHILKLDDVKETLEDKTDEENQDSNSQHDDSECEKESHVEDVEDEEGVCPICLSEYGMYNCITCLLSKAAHSNLLSTIRTKMMGKGLSSEVLADTCTILSALCNGWKRSPMNAPFVDQT